MSELQLWGTVAEMGGRARGPGAQRAGHLAHGAVIGSIACSLVVLTWHFPAAPTGFEPVSLP